jgi:hypothetical protein
MTWNGSEGLQAIIIADVDNEIVCPHQHLAAFRINCLGLDRPPAGFNHFSSHQLQVFWSYPFIIFRVKPVENRASEFPVYPEFLEGKKTEQGIGFHMFLLANLLQEAYEEKQ